MAAELMDCRLVYLRLDMVLAEVVVGGAGRECDRALQGLPPALGGLGDVSFQAVGLGNKVVWIGEPGSGLRGAHEEVAGALTVPAAEEDAAELRHGLRALRIGCGKPLVQLAVVARQRIQNQLVWEPDHPSNLSPLNLFLGELR